MATFRKLEDIEVWQLARSLSSEIYQLCEGPEYKKDNGMRYQMLNSSGSIADNIAEGFGRRGNKEFHCFLMIAGGSAEELKSQLYRSLDRGFLTEENFNDFKLKLDRIITKLNNLAGILKKSEFKGQRYKIEHDGINN
jgi:four helix bundle protein